MRLKDSSDRSFATRAATSQKPVRGGQGRRLSAQPGVGPQGHTAEADTVAPTANDRRHTVLPGPGSQARLLSQDALHHGPSVPAPAPAANRRQARSTLPESPPGPDDKAQPHGPLPGLGTKAAAYASGRPARERSTRASSVRGVRDSPARPLLRSPSGKLKQPGTQISLRPHKMALGPPPPLAGRLPLPPAPRPEGKGVARRHRSPLLRELGLAPGTLSIWSGSDG